MTEIAGRAAVVTGGGSGIGMGLALELARQGAGVAVADLRQEAAARVAERIAAAGGTAVALACDVTDRASIARMRDEAADALGPVTLVFANAGATSFEPLTEMADADVDWIVQVNLMGAMNTVRAFLPGMVAAGGGGHIVGTSSINGLLPGWSMTHVPYSAAKAGIIGLMMNVALELAPHGIRTTTYCPGGVASGMKLNNGRYRPDRFGGPQEGELRVSDNAAASGDFRFYTPDQVAPMVLRAVRADRPFVFDHAEQRALFRSLYSDVVEACFDDLDAYEREFGRPAANPTGPVLVDGG